MVYIITRDSCGSMILCVLEVNAQAMDCTPIYCKPRYPHTGLCGDWPCILVIESPTFDAAFCIKTPAIPRKSVNPL